MNLNRIGDTKVEASITNKNMILILGTYFSYEEKTNSNENAKKLIGFHEYENCHKFQSGKVRVTTLSIYRLTYNHSSKC